MPNKNVTQHAMLLYASPVLLILVASIQYYLASAHHLNPIKGGGFGMFAGHNTNALRTITLTVVEPEGHRIRAPLPLTSTYGRLFGELKVLPLSARVKRLVAKLLQEKWIKVLADRPAALTEEYIQESSKALAFPTEPLHVRGIDIAFWEYQFDGTSGKLTRKLLLRASATHPKPSR